MSLAWTLPSGDSTESTLVLKSAEKELEFKVGCMTHKQKYTQHWLESDPLKVKEFKQRGGKKHFPLIRPLLKSEQVPQSTFRCQSDRMMTDTAFRSLVWKTASVDAQAMIDAHKEKAKSAVGDGDQTEAREKPKTDRWSHMRQWTI